MTTTHLATQIKDWGKALGFDQIGITDLNVSAVAPWLQQWLDQHYHGTMGYMEKHVDKRLHPQQLMAGAQSAIVARMNYLPPDAPFDAVYEKPLKANISRYAQHRDYHSLIRKRLAKLALQIEHHLGRPLQSRAFTDSAPVLEKPLAEKAGLGWQGKHTNLIHPEVGSWFFLGVLYLDISLPLDPSFAQPLNRYHPGTRTLCGSCTQCIDICPTKAIIAPYQLDARRCISYLTIEHDGSIPMEFRPLIGNRIYGCDDCQLVCPWNKHAKASRELAFHSKRGFSAPDLVDLFSWNETTFLKNTEGSPIRRIGHERWLRNIAVALGNAPSTPEVLQTLYARHNDSSELVREHVAWALQQH